jgi:hypothetical protein
MDTKLQINCFNNKQEATRPCAYNENTTELQGSEVGSV